MMTRIFLPGQKNPVNRPQAGQNIVRMGGEDTRLGAMSNFRRLCVLADGKPDETSGYYDED